MKTKFFFFLNRYLRPKSEASRPHTGNIDLCSYAIDFLHLSSRPTGLIHDLFFSPPLPHDIWVSHDDSRIAEHRQRPTNNPPPHPNPEHTHLSFPPLRLFMHAVNQATPPSVLLKTAVRVQAKVSMQKSSQTVTN